MSYNQLPISKLLTIGIDGIEVSPKPTNNGEPLRLLIVSCIENDLFESLLDCSIEYRTIPSNVNICVAVGLSVANCTLITLG